MKGIDVLANMLHECVKENPTVELDHDGYGKITVVLSGAGLPYKPDSMRLVENGLELTFSNPKAPTMIRYWLDKNLPVGSSMTCDGKSVLRITGDNMFIGKAFGFISNFYDCTICISHLSMNELQYELNVYCDKDDANAMIFGAVKKGKSNDIR